MIKLTLMVIAILLPLTSTAVPQFAPMGQGAMIWFYRPADSPYPREVPTIYEVGGITRTLAKVAPGEFFGYSVVPGVHVLSYTRAPARGESIAVTLKAGQQAYVEVHFREFRQVSEDDGIDAIQRSRSISESSALDNSVIVLASAAPPKAATTPRVEPTKAPVFSEAKPLPPAPVAAAIPREPTPPPPAKPQPAPPQPVKPIEAEPAATVPMILNYSETFQKVTLNVQVDDKKREIDSVIKFDKTALIVTDKKKEVLKTFPYANVTSTEYSYGKSPRWKSALLVSPFFLFTSGKKHWLMVQASDDYALMQLDKSNYKLILAALEVRTGRKVETVQDSK